MIFSQGDIHDHENLVKAIKQVDVVISTVGSEQLADQEKIIAAIKEVGNVKASNFSWFSKPFLFFRFGYFLSCFTKIVRSISDWPFKWRKLPEFQRFLPSEFGIDVDRVHAVEPVASLWALKTKIRRAVEAEGIPYTYVISNALAGYFLPTLAQPNATAPPRDKIIILGDGNPKGFYSNSAI